MLGRGVRVVEDLDPAGLRAGCLSKIAPTRPSYHSQSRSLADAECSPTQPPPARMYRWSADRCSAFSKSPVSGVELVLLKTTAWKRPRSVSLKTEESAVASTAKPCSAPSFSMAATPAGIEGWSELVTSE
ncbi:hypothetical protein GA0115280_1029121 [Streptomyces sp. Cmuel-A718b]|nr:hypothetical protein GA0115280_1029121 [Streptomyces sp. Cmuel-A718b]